ncbi:hypothetical protein BRCH_03399 [Candidatus Burkholderia brachyanthoides]|nr:hypothetical protein BRCH_03399 [Candidatus Burkholderia brachyanthoides]
MAAFAVTVKGQSTLKRGSLQHLGIKPGERVDFEKLPGGELRVRAARPTGTIDGFLHALDGKVKLKKPLSIEEMNNIAMAGWAGELDRSYKMIRRRPVPPRKLLKDADPHCGFAAVAM